VSKTQTKKLLYIIAAVAMLAMLIPLAVPVAAADPPLLPAPNPVVPGVTLDPAEARDIIGHTQRFTSTGGAVVTGWSVNNTSPVGADATIVASTLGVGGYADVVAYKMGSAIITATTTTGTQVGEKKWGKIDRTAITPPRMSM